MDSRIGGRQCYLPEDDVDPLGPVDVWKSDPTGQAVRSKGVKNVSLTLLPKISILIRILISISLKTILKILKKILLKIILKILLSISQKTILKILKKI